MSNEAKKDALLPIYLIVGEDELKKQTVLKRLKARVESFGDISFNYDEFNGENAAGADIVSACNTMPFASELRLVRINAADKLKKSDTEELIEYLKSPSSTTVLALVADKLAKNTRLYKTIASFGKNAVIECLPLKRYELTKTLRSIAVGHGITLSEGAAQALVDLVGENTIHLDGEIRKIALYHRGNDAVNEHEVRALISRTAEVKPWEFVDAFAARNIEKALRCLGRMNTVSPHALLAMCVTRLRELICARALIERGTTHELAKLLKVPDWRVKNHLNWARQFTQKELRDALIQARETERRMKSGTSPEDAFLDWTLSVLR